MSTSRRFNRIIISILIIIMSVYFGNAVVTAVNAGQQKTVILLFLIPIGMMVPYFLARFGTQTFISIILLSFWLPTPFIFSYFPSVFGNMDIFEAVVWFIPLLLLANSAVARNAQFMSRLKDFPFKPFLLYIVGAVMTYFISYKVGGELSLIRIMCVFPMFVSLTIFLTMKSTVDAERYLWAVLISASLLGLLFLFGPRISNFVTETTYAAGTGRASLQLAIPFFGSLWIDPAGAGDKFAFMFTIAYSFCLFQRSTKARTAAVLMCLIFGAVIVYAQGRAGLLAVVASSVFITLFSLKRKGTIRFDAILLLGFMVVIILGGSWYLATHSNLSRFTDRITILLSDPMHDVNFVGRLEGWKMGLGIMARNPLGIGLFGWGVSGSDTWIVHNLWLYLSLSFGVIGLAGFLWIILTFIRAFWRGVRRADLEIKNLCIIGIGLLIDLIVTGQFSPVVREPYSVGIVWIPLATIYTAIILYQRRSLKSDTSQNQSRVANTIA